MIQAEHLTRHPVPRPVIRAIQGGKELDFQRFAETLKMLESYVDGVLARGEMSTVDTGSKRR
mgnify:CR=1 FL=1